MAAVHPSQDAAVFDDSGRLYRLIADTVPLVVWTARADGTVDFVNRRLLEYTGLDAHALAGWGWEKIVHPDDLEQSAARWNRALQSGERLENEQRLRRADGEYRWHHSSGVPLRDDEGRVVRWFGISTDIDAEERLRELRQAQARLRALIDNEPECVKLVDAEGRLLEMNAAGLRMIEAESAEAVLGHSVYGLIAPEHVAAFRDLTERVCRGERGILEFEVIGVKGTRRWLETHAVPFRDEASGETRLLAVTRDITERRQAQQALRESEQRFQLFLDRLPAMAWIRDSNFRYTYVNRGYAAAWGFEREALIGRDAAELFPPDKAEYFRASDRKVARERVPIEYTDAQPSGRWLKMKFPVPDGAGGVGVAGIGLDITERSRLEEQLRESEQRFQLFMQHLPVIAWIRDSKQRYTFVNRFYEKAFGLRAEEVIGKEASRFFSTEVAASFEKSDRQVQREGAPLQYVDPFPSGRWLKMKFPIPDPEGGVGVAGIGLDITERSRLEEALRESEQRFRAFMEHVPAAAWIKDARLRYTYVNRTYERVYGRATGDILGREDFELHAPELARFFREEDEKILRSGEAGQRMHEVPYADGRPGHWLVVKFPLGDAAGETGVAGMAIDVTPRLEAEEKARRYAEEVRTLVGRLVQAQEAERRRVADGLHDLIGQNLTALGIDLQALKQRLQSAGDQIAAPRLDAMAALVETTIDAIRGVMTDLRPVALEEFGLVPALRWYASQFSKRTGIKVTTKAPRREVRLPADLELALFRIVQEALTNAAKHSGCASVEIKLRYAEQVKLTVQDDGCGFSEPVGARSARRGGGFGLTTMRERAEAQGGALRVEFPGRGTRIVVELPRQVEIPKAGDGD